MIATLTRDLDALRRRLFQRRVELLRKVASFDDDLRWLETNVPPELEEESQEQTIARLLMRLDDRSTAEIHAVDHALARLAEGVYDACEDCDEPIPVERQQALPTATTCISCAEARERERLRKSA